jgi:hypothetical protein
VDMQSDFQAGATSRAGASRPEGAQGDKSTAGWARESELNG